jgi:hypothetical protein
MKPLSTIVVAEVDRNLLEGVNANLYDILFAFRDQLVDSIVKRNEKRYIISAVEWNDNKIVAFVHHFPQTETE